MPRIVETIVTTMDAAGEAYIAPLGLIEEGPHWIIAPFKPSKTLRTSSRIPSRRRAIRMTCAYLLVA